MRLNSAMRSAGSGAAAAAVPGVLALTPVSLRPPGSVIRGERVADGGAGDRNGRAPGYPTMSRTDDMARPIRCDGAYRTSATSDARRRWGKRRDTSVAIYCELPNTEQEGFAWPYWTEYQNTKGNVIVDCTSSISLVSSREPSTTVLADQGNERRDSSRVRASGNIVLAPQAGSPAPE